MKKLFVKILSVCLLLAVVLEDVSPFFSNKETTILVLEKEEESKGKELEKEKDSKEKLFHEQLVYLTIAHHRSLFITDHTSFKYSAYLSLPEIPPKQA